jgi:hypothetical protein
MTMQRRIKVEHGDVFPAGAFLKGSVVPVADFRAERRPDGSRPQQVDKESGELLWQVTVVDADEEAGKKETAVSVKFAAKVRPVPPEKPTAMPWTPVEFVGLSALPYVEYTGGKDNDGHDRTRIVWSYRAEDMVAAGTAGQKPEQRAEQKAEHAPEPGAGKPAGSKSEARAVA